MVIKHFELRGEKSRVWKPVQVADLSTQGDLKNTSTASPEKKIPNSWFALEYDDQP